MCRVRLNYPVSLHAGLQSESSKVDVLPAARGFLLSESATMQRLAPLLCISLWLLCLHPGSLSEQQSLKFRYEQHRKSPREAHGGRRFCDPSFSNQTAGVTGQVNQLCEAALQRSSLFLCLFEAITSRNKCYVNISMSIKLFPFSFS